MNYPVDPYPTYAFDAASLEALVFITAFEARWGPIPVLPEVDYSL